MAADKPKPNLLMLTVCDEIIRDEQTKKFSLIGMFSQVWSTQFPVQHRKMVVFVSLTGGRGNYEGELRLVESGATPGAAPLLGIKATINFPEPLSTIDIIFALNNVVFPHPGKYHFEFLADGEVIGYRRFVVELTKGK